MKKIYKEPKIKAVKVNLHQMVCSSLVEQLDITDEEEGVLPPI